MPLPRLPLSRPSISSPRFRGKGRCALITTSLMAEAGLYNSVAAHPHPPHNSRSEYVLYSIFCSKGGGVSQIVCIEETENASSAVFRYSFAACSPHRQAIVTRATAKEGGPAMVHGRPCPGAGGKGSWPVGVVCFTSARRNNILPVGVEVFVLICWCASWDCLMGTGPFLRPGFSPCPGAGDFVSKNGLKSAGSYSAPKKKGRPH